MSMFLHARKFCARLAGRARVRVGVGVAAWLISICVGAVVVLSQSQGRTITVTSVAVSQTAGGSAVSISGDSSLARAQARQDGDKFFVSIANAKVSEAVKSVPGVTVSTINGAVEIVVQLQQGVKVTSTTQSNRLELIIEGQIVGDATTVDPNLRVDVSPAAIEVKPQVTPAIESNAGQAAAQEGSLVSTLFSKTSVLIVLALAGFGLLVVYRVGSNKLSSRRLEQAGKSAAESPALPVEALPAKPFTIEAPVDAVQVGGVHMDEMEEQASDSFVPAQASNSESAALYGAYRVDQEVGKLVLGQPHRLDVLGSRSFDDRHAIEVSLMKILGAGGMPEDAKRRARQALEEYGFVARQCATLLLASEAFNRVTAARVLGEIKSAMALPFLLEALYDTEAGVRNQAIGSIGELKLPSAIGALLDLARRHPDVPSGLLSQSLSACSVEGLDFFDSQTSGTATNDLPVTAALPRLNNTELPETLQDEGLVQALANLKEANSATRTEAIQELGNFRAQVSVQALVAIARSGLSAEFKAAAISSLGRINHHSVFPAVLIGMADEAREVRAAAARALNRLTFDRGDAYVRVIETAGAETIRDVARACINAEIVSQALDRLASMDNRQAFEALSLISLLARADMADPVFDAISKHPSLEVRVAAAKLLVTTGDPKVINRLRLMAVEAGIDEEVRKELLETLTRAQEKSEVVNSNGEDSLQELRSSIYSIREGEVGKARN